MTEVVSPHNNKIGPLPDSKIIAGRKITEISAASVFNVIKMMKNFVSNRHQYVSSVYMSQQFEELYGEVLIKKFSSLLATLRKNNLQLLKSVDWIFFS